MTFGDKARVEIERKFLVAGEGWRAGNPGVDVRQGFLCAAEDGPTVRVRSVSGAGIEPRGVVTIKGPTRGISRAEYEYEIPVAEADAMLESLCVGTLVRKTRYRIPHAGLVWEVDVFHADNAGLLLAEVELDDPDQPVVLPDWVGEEVSRDPRYFNAYLARHPYSTWPIEDRSTA